MNRKPAVTRREIQELETALVDEFMGFVIDGYGPSALPEEEVERLVRLGIIDIPGAAEVSADFIRDAFLGGAVIQRLSDLQRQIVDLPPDRIAAELRRNPIPLSARDRDALDWARASAAEKCRGLGKRCALEAGQEIWTFDEDLARADEAVIRQQTGRAVAERRTQKELRARLGELTGAYEQDLDRVAATELQDAHNEGAASEIRRTSGPGAMVAKIPNPNACEQCRSLYTTNGTRPRLFPLEELEANGDNVRRKRAQWLPVIGTTHPWCACRLLRVPGGFEFTDSGMLVPIGAK